MFSSDDIIGTWLLTKRGTSDGHQAALLARYGANSKGIVVLSADGWLVAALEQSNRAKLPGNPIWHTDAPDKDRLAAFDSFISYAGRWRIEGNSLITKVEFALNPNWVGGEQIREVKLLDDGTLRLVVTRAWPNGTEVSVWVDWQRSA